ncbi:hypothetical protein BS50DRAFT_615527 [Corynespora cassiicola Philippines]|uniref:5'-3' DNA helicase ZGRF1-like N-terminal domain-containing protein n=1 Tax=Corynespora cassiicola Philippines TaxID=1448308 RepID=A0A2T2PAL4_CORCC|nr:hypothetical protein BS50DRAFT_615527 [Corynespora cassiicola Philippines]
MRPAAPWLVAHRVALVGVGRAITAVRVASRRRPSPHASTLAIPGPASCSPQPVDNPNAHGDAPRPTLDAMTAPLRATPRLTAIPASQNTAPVAEFRCLYTLDLRRKQKRWQDGFLKFHTFNSRVMVYDTLRNFVGDTHWKESGAVQEGDELTLDKGVMVEVADAVGVTQTDLTPLFEKNRESSPPQQSRPDPPRPAPRPAVPSASHLRTNSQLRHKSLSALLGTPRGPIGKALPIKSPYEQRQEQRERDHELAGERATKRQKPVHAAVLPSGRYVVPASNPPVPAAPIKATAQSARPTLEHAPRPVTVISLDSEPDIVSSGVTLPSTPPELYSTAQPSTSTPAMGTKHSVPKKTPRKNTPKLPRGKIPLPQNKTKETPPPPPRPSSPPVSASNRITNVDFALQPNEEQEKQPVRSGEGHSRNEHIPVLESSPEDGSEIGYEQTPMRPPAKARLKAPAAKPQKEPYPQKSPPRHPKAKSLRLSKGPKRGMLLCQSLSQQQLQRSRTPGESRTVPLESHETSRAASREPISILSDEDVSLIQEECAKVSKDLASNKQKRKSTGREQVATKKAKTAEPVFELHDNDFNDIDDMELVHGLMDQKLVTPPKSCTAPKSTSSNVSAAQSAGAKRVQTKGKAKSPEEAQAVSEPGVPAANPSAKRKPAKPKVVKDAFDKSQRFTKASSVEPTTEVPHNPKPTAPASPKKAALSTGGFCKKAKKAPGTSTERSSNLASETRPATSALPPHPLTAKRPGPLMTTRELSALLQRQSSMEDPIEDEGQTSPNKKIQRSRSENDAPIPSTSEEWERRNLASIAAKESTSTTADMVDVADTADKENSPATEQASETQKPKPKPSGLAALVKKTDPRKRFLRTQSLHVDTSASAMDPAADSEPEIASPPIDTDVGPWSTEAFDLFDWRPPAKEGADQGIGVLKDGR